MPENEKVIKTTFKLRRGNAATFAANNPILAQGEPAYELDTNKLKIGDGVTAYNNLEYVAEGQLLGENGKILAEYLPSYVDDVLNGTYVNSTRFNNEYGQPYVPMTGVIYVDTVTNKTYRWSGEVYVRVDEGETVHNHLSGRDAAAAHPASAIDVNGTPLNQVLTAKADIDPETNRLAQEQAPVANETRYTKHYEVGEAGKEINVEKALNYTSEGYASEFYFRTSGWKRVACIMRSHCGELGLSLTYNVWAKGRATQNLLLSYNTGAKYATTPYPSSGTPITNICEPIIYQLSNVVSGENFKDTRYLNRINLIDKVRIVGIPGDSAISNKMVSFIDIHVVNKGNPDGYELLNADGKEFVQLKLNLAGKSYNNSVFPIDEEINVDDLTQEYTFINNRVEVTGVLEEQASLNVDFDNQLVVKTIATEKLTFLNDVSSVAELDAAFEKQYSTIRLINNIDYNKVLTIPNEVTIDLNGYNLYIKGLINNGNPIVKNNGKVWARVNSNDTLSATVSAASVTNYWAANEELLNPNTEFDGIYLSTNLGTAQAATTFANLTTLLPNLKATDNYILQGNNAYFVPQIPVNKFLDLNGKGIHFYAVATSMQGGTIIDSTGDSGRLRFMYNDSTSRGTYEKALALAATRPNQKIFRFQQAGTMDYEGLEAIPANAFLTCTAANGAATNVVFAVDSIEDFSKEGTNDNKISYIGFELVKDLKLTSNINIGNKDFDFNDYFVIGGAIITTGSITYNNGGYRVSNQYVEEYLYNNAISAEEKGVANGVPTLDENGKVPNEQLNLNLPIAVFDYDDGFTTWHVADIVDASNAGKAVFLKKDNLLLPLAAIEESVDVEDIYYNPVFVGLDDQKRFWTARVNQVMADISLTNHGAVAQTLRLNSTTARVRLTAAAGIDYVYTQELISLDLSFDIGTHNDKINIAFKSGSTATALTLSGDNYIINTTTVPANSIVEISAKYIIDRWIVKVETTEISQTSQE